MVRIDADFENGSLGQVTRITKNWYHIGLRPDTWYWTHFRTRGCKNQEITFTLTYLPVPEGQRWGSYDPNDAIVVKPVVSYDRKNWREVYFAEKYKAMPDTICFRHTFTGNEAYVCHSVPYTYSDLKTYLSRIKSNPRLKIETIGKTHYGNNEPVLTITGNEKARNLVLLVAREDSDEATTSYAVEGIINHLLDGKDPEVNAILKRFVFKIIPMVSIEAVITGSPFGAAYDVMAQRWADSPAPPEIENVKQGLKKWLRDGYKLVLAGKLHGAQSHDAAPCNIISDNQKLREILSTVKIDGWEAWAKEIWMRPVGFFERYLMDDYGFRTSFATHIHGKNEEDCRKKGRGLVKVLFNYLKTS